MAASTLKIPKKLHEKLSAALFSSPKISGSGTISNINAVSKDPPNIACVCTGSSDFIINIKTSKTGKITYQEFAKRSLLDNTPLSSCEDPKATLKLKCQEEKEVYSYVCKGSSKRCPGKAKVETSDSSSERR